MIALNIQAETCIGCTGTELIEQAAQGYLQSSRTVTYVVDREDCGTNYFEVFRGSMLDPPRGEGIAMVEEELASDVGVDMQEPLRCANGCDFLACAAARLAIEPVNSDGEILPEKDLARKVFYGALEVVQQKYRQQIMSYHR